jgi:hypothetical protein
MLPVNGAADDGRFRIRSMRQILGFAALASKRRSRIDQENRA